MKMKEFFCKKWKNLKNGKNEKMKKMKKWKKKKKTEKMKKKLKKWKYQNEKILKNEKMKKWSNLASHAISSTMSRVYRCCCNFFRQNPRRFPWFCFGMCLFREENQQPVLGGHRFSEEKWQFALDVKQKYTFHTKMDEKLLRSVPLTIIILLE